MNTVGEKIDICEMIADGIIKGGEDGPNWNAEWPSVAITARISEARVKDPNTFQMR